MVDWQGKEPEEQYVGICVVCKDPVKPSELGAEVRGKVVDYQTGFWDDLGQARVFLCRKCNEEYRDASKKGIRAAVNRFKERSAFLAAEAAGADFTTLEPAEG
jgi:hypothetical protein